MPGQPNPASRRLASWIALGMALLVLGLTVGLNLYIEYGRTIAREKKNLLLQTRIVQTVVGKNLIALDSVLSALREKSSPGHLPANINHQLILLANALTGVRTLAIYDADGNILASNRDELIGRNFRHREYFTTMSAQENTRTVYLSRPFKTVLNAYTMTVGRMIPGPDGEFNGIVVASLDPMFFVPVLESVLLTPDTWVNLVHADGTIFLALPENNHVEGKNIAKPGTLFTRHMESGRETSVFIDKVFSTGEYRMLAVRSIAPGEMNLCCPLVLGIARDYHSILSGWRRDLIIQSFLYLALLILSSTSLYLFQKRKLKSEKQLARTSEALAKRDRFIRMVTDNLPDLVSYWDTEMRCEYANEAYGQWFEKSKEEVVGMAVRDLLSDEWSSTVEQRINAALAGEEQAFERTHTKVDGTAGHSLVRYVPDIVDDKVKGVYVLAADISELKSIQLELEKRIEELDILATTDPLTGLSNRRHFLGRAQEEFARSVRYGLPLSFLMIDVDHFKGINDLHGHDVGDRILQLLADSAKETMRETDRVGRLGGEEFGVLLVQTTAEQAKITANRLRQILSTVCIQTETGSLCFTVSIGIAAYGDDVDSLEALMKRADQALYHAKENGRDRISCYGEF